LWRRGLEQHSVNCGHILEGWVTIAQRFDAGCAREQAISPGATAQIGYALCLTIEPLRCDLSAEMVISRRWTLHSCSLPLEGERGSPTQVKRCPKPWIPPVAWRLLRAISLLLSAGILLAPLTLSAAEEIPLAKFTDITTAAGITFTHINGAYGDKLL